MIASAHDEPVRTGLAPAFAAVLMARLSGEQKNKALLAVASGIGRHREEILAANALDLLTRGTAVESGRMSAGLYDRLKLDDSKLSTS